MSKPPILVHFLVRIYIYSLLILGVLRFCLFHYANTEHLPFFDKTVLKSFLIGVQFDSVILAYILSLLLILLAIQSLLQISKKYVQKFVAVYLSIVYPLLIFITIADIPYFKFFGNRLSEASFQWFGNIDIVANMIISNPINLFLLIVALAAAFLSGWGVYRYTRNKIINYDWDTEYKNTTKAKYTLSFLVLAAFCFMGMRGTISHPIRQGDAFYCDNALLNQLGLNPVFTILKSYTSKVNLMGDEQAIAETQELLKIHDPIISYSPIAREVKSSLPIKKPNIIIVLMESMSANYMGTFGNKNKLTPTLDSLAGVSWFFKNAYSSGIHTNNGVFSVLYSFPALKRIRPMSTVPTRTYSGLPYTLKQNGYKNLFFSTHDKMFDNLANFIPGNFFDKLYTSENYPADKIIGPYGVPDDYLFSYATQVVNQFDSTQPFFATILTTSNHDPYIIPDYYKSTITEKDLKAVSYADWSISKFLTHAKTQKWFDNTIFVFVSDHGLNVGNNPYEMALSYNHIPIIMYAPKLLGEAKVLDNFIGQIDIFPTLMGILNFNYINNTLGTDVINNKRECIYFSADDKLGCLNEEYLFVHTFGGNESLYKYKNGDTKNYSVEKKPELEKLKNYSFAQTQVAQWIYASNKSSIVKNKE